MKKNISILTVAILTAIAIPSQAQVKFGVKGGLALPTDLAQTWENKVGSGNYTGYFIGPMVEVGTRIEGLSFDGAVMYSEKGHKLQGDTYKQAGIEVPLNVKYTYDLNQTIGFYAAVGPYVFYNFNSEDELTIGAYTGEISYKKVEAGGNFGLGIKLFKHLQVGANYNVPFMQTAQAKISGHKNDYSNAWGVLKGKSYKTRTWQISVAYIF